MKVVIVGAGIGGLALALMLHKEGIACEVFESVQEIRPLGVGINLLPHAVATLEPLGLLETLRQNAVETSALHYYNRYGKTIWEEPRGLAAGYPVPQLSIHRGVLQLLLLDAVRERLGHDKVHPGLSFESLEQDANGVRARFRQRSTGDVQTVQCDVLIGADGIHSAVRKNFYPENDSFRFSGRILWRAVTYTEPFLDGRTMFMAGHQDQKFVAYPLADDGRHPGRTPINWIAELTVGDIDRPSTDWNRQVDKSVFEQPFQSWRWDWIDIPALIDAAEAIYEFPLVDKDPLPRWSFGRATLMGDAAHPLYPIGSNGAAQAVLDARSLADRLVELGRGRHRDAQAALKEYEADRLPPTTGVILRNRLNGPEQVMQLAHERAPNGFNHIHEAVSEAELNEIAMRYKRVAGFDPSSIRPKQSA